MDRLGPFYTKFNLVLIRKLFCFFGDLIEQLGFRQRYFWNWGTIPEQNIKKTDKACFLNPIFHPG